MVSFPLRIWRHRRLVWRLATTQLRDRYASTAIGSLWAILQPIMMILVFWWSYSRLVEDLPKRPLVILFGIQIAAFGAVFSNCYDLQAGQLVGAVGGALAGMSLIVWKWPDRCDLTPTIPVLTMLLAPMLTIQHSDFFGSVPRTASACLAALPILGVMSLRLCGCVRA